MQISRFEIDNHKCLVDFKVLFSIVDGGSSSIIIGENGTGKSSMLESLLYIMTSYESDAIEKSIDYSYRLDYLFAGSQYRIDEVEHKYRIEIDGEPLYSGSMGGVREMLRKTKKRMFPSRVMVFYSGTNSLMYSQIKRINSRYVAQSRKALLDYGKALRSGVEQKYEHFPERRFNYCEDSLTPVLLASIMGGQESAEKRILSQYCHFSNIHYIKLSVDMDEMLLRFGLYDRVDEIVDDVYTVLEYVDPVLGKYLRSCYEYSNDGKAFFELENITSLDLDSITIFNFFEKLLSLFKAEIEINIFQGETSVKSSQLSEGQRQLIKMLGMLGLSKNEDCLVLMDEPDAHMNPRWKYEIKPIIDECLKSATNTQAIIATHDPLVINGVDKGFIRIFTFNPHYIEKYNWYFTRVIEPTEDTEGLGIDGLLQSEYYGLRTSYDKKATDKFTRRQELYSKLVNGDADEDEKEELRALTKEIGSLPMSYNSIDFLYDDFISVYKNTDLFAKQYLSFDEIQKRRKKIEEILTALYEGQV